MTTSGGRRDSFDSAADLYEQARPGYPQGLFDDLVELGHRLAERARRNLAGLPVEIEVAPFEQWAGAEGSFDLVFAATAWHWLDPALRYEKAHRVLRPGGHLAFWSALHAFPRGFDPFFEEIQEAYDAIGSRWQGEWPPPRPGEIADDRAEVEGSGLFEDVQVRRYVWEQSYTADEYVALLGTFSNHITLEAEKRDYLLAEIRRRIGERGDPRVRRHWYAILHVARRIEL